MLHCEVVHCYLHEYGAYIHNSYVSRDEYIPKAEKESSLSNSLTLGNLNLCAGPKEKILFLTCTKIVS